MLEQWASVRDVKCSATFPVFSTVILYSTVWPTLPVNLAVVYELSPWNRCSLWIVNSGCSGSTTTSTLFDSLNLHEVPGVFP